VFVTIGPCFPTGRRHKPQAFATINDNICTGLQRLCGPRVKLHSPPPGTAGSAGSKKPTPNLRQGGKCSHIQASAETKINNKERGRMSEKMQLNQGVAVKLP
jgi:hypothetical protein